MKNVTRVQLGYKHKHGGGGMVVGGDGKLEMRDESQGGSVGRERRDVCVN